MKKLFILLVMAASFVGFAGCKTDEPSPSKNEIVRTIELTVDSSSYKLYVLYDENDQMERAAGYPQKKMKVYQDENGNIVLNQFSIIHAGPGMYVLEADPSICSGGVSIQFMTSTCEESGGLYKRKFADISNSSANIKLFVNGIEYAQVLMPRE